jgi:hypothetical protein
VLAERITIMPKKERRMRRLASRCIAFFVACTVLSVNLVPAYAFAVGDCHPVPHEDAAGHSDHHPANTHDPIGDATTYACCFCCIVAPIAIAAAEPVVSTKIVPVTYFGRASHLAGVSIRPDPSPPRPIA